MTRELLLGAALVLGACAKTPTTLEDTEGRVFETTCKDNVCALTQRDGPRSTSRKSQLVTTSRVVMICDASRAGTAPAPATCRPVICESDVNCPVLGDGQTQATCKRKLCIDPSEELRVQDSVALCLAGTRIGRRTARQAERYALGLNCGNPCTVPAACRLP